MSKDAKLQRLMTERRRVSELVGALEDVAALTALSPTPTPNRHRSAHAQYQEDHEESMGSPPARHQGERERAKRAQRIRAGKIPANQIKAP